MKKVKIIFIILSVLLISVSFIKQETVKAADPLKTKATLDITSYYSASIHFTSEQATSDMEMPGATNGQFFKFYLNTSTDTNRTFCLNHNLIAKDGDIFIIENAIEDVYGRDAEKLRRAYYYGVNGSFEDQIAAQIMIWLVGVSKVSKLRFVNAYAEAICQYENGNSKECYIGGDKWNDYFGDNGSDYAKIYKKLTQLGTMYTGKLYKWKSIQTIDGRPVYGVQPMLGPLMIGTFVKPDDPTTPTDPSDPTPTFNPDNGVIEKEGYNASCTNDGTSNFGTFSEVFNNAVDGDANKFGSINENIFTTNNYCKLYCLEEATQVFPGSVTEPVPKGTILTWPTSTGTSPYENKYNLGFTGKKTCTIIMAGTKYDTFGGSDPVADYRKYYNLASDYQNNYYDGITVETASSGASESCDEKYSDTIKKYSDLVSYYSGKLASANQEVANLEASRNSLLADKARVESTCTYSSSYVSPLIFHYIPGVGNKQVGTLKITKNCDTWNGYTALSAVESSLNSARSNASSLSASLNSNQAMLDSYKAKRASCNSDVNSYEAALSGMYTVVSQLKQCGNIDALASQSQIYNFESNATLNVDLGNSSKLVDLVGSTSYSCDGDCKGANINYSFPNPNTTTAWRNYSSKTSSSINTEIVQKIGTGETQFTLNASTYYSIPGYVDPELDNKDLNITYPGFKVSKNIDTTKSYNLTINNTELGHEGNFNELLGGSYTCDYKPTDDHSANCLCPAGTDNEFKDLSGLMDSQNLTCNQAQEQCNGTITDSPKKYCPDKAINLSPCLKYHDYNWCVSNFCNNYPEHTCPSSYKDNEGKSITNCVMTKMSQGLNETDAVSECEASLCSLGDGIRIIYRTIDLDNPYPGKDIANVTWGFNDSVKGRYPGVNWNDKDLVKDEILYNRGTDGDSVYRKDPLYSFELTPSIIRSIRGYNDAQSSSGGYADYTLDCKDNNATACVSGFIHGTSNIGSVGLVGGTCVNATSKNDFYACAER